MHQYPFVRPRYVVSTYVSAPHIVCLNIRKAPLFIMMHFVILVCCVGVVIDHGMLCRRRSQARRRINSALLGDKMIIFALQVTAGNDRIWSISNRAHLNEWRLVRVIRRVIVSTPRLTMQSDISM